MLLGDAGADQLFGDAGNDTIWGGASVVNGGIDSVSGGADTDTLTYEFLRHDPEFGLAVSKVNLGSVVIDLESAPGGDFTGIATFTDLDGFDYITWIKEIENLIGTAYADDLAGNDDNNEIQGGEGDDSIRGDQGADTLNGGLGDDTVSGNKGGDRIFGTAGFDSLDGGNGNDVLDYSLTDAGVVFDIALGVAQASFAVAVYAGPIPAPMRPATRPVSPDPRGYRGDRGAKLCHQGRPLG